MNKKVFCILGGVLLNSGCGDINIFTIDDDIQLGKDLREEILANPEDYPIVDESAYPEAYEHLRRVRDEILDSGEVTYKDDFDWEVYLIDDDETLNAFAAPGGYMWVYTGLLKFLPVEDHFAGVLGHEIAHADQRHSTEQLTKLYGVSTMLDLLVGGDAELLSEVTETLVGLEFSRTDESEADEYSVRYLCETIYAANGAAGFFELLGDDFYIEFISTHPSPENRVAEINDLAESLGCSAELNPDDQYQSFLNSLP